MRVVATCLAVVLLWPASTFAKSANLPEIRAIETESTDVFEVLQRLSDADTALALRDYQSARQGYESVLMHDPTLESARFGLRRTLIASGDIEQAARLVDDINSADAVLINVLSGASNAPMKELKTALQTHQDPRLWNALGRLQDRDGDHAKARQSYAMAGLLGQRAGLADNNIGQSHLLAGETQKALQAFMRATVSDPSDLRFDNNRRRTLVMIGETRQAIAGLTAERASLFLTQAGDQARLTGDKKLARFLYRRSLELAPRHLPETDRKLAELNQ